MVCHAGEASAVADSTSDGLAAVEASAEVAGAVASKRAASTLVSRVRFFKTLARTAALQNLTLVGYPAGNCLLITGGCIAAKLKRGLQAVLNGMRYSVRQMTKQQDTGLPIMRDHELAPIPDYGPDTARHGHVTQCSLSYALAASTIC